MRLRDRYPIIVTAQKQESRDFWERYLGFRTVFDSIWFTLMTDTGSGASIAFMAPDHPSAPPGPDTFTGRGMCFELEVDDAASTHAELTRRGLPVTYPLTDEPFGQRRFGFADPSGLWVDVVEQIEPEAGYWSRYMQREDGSDPA
ncbi:VOC family protein [Actinomyces sp. ZJ308]|uniref:VOC family protein n=1 Tax=Actinomyces sp. ZJ308 TaxID=2708342 RepID=UPI001421DFE8|nr:VOC family protein [Actinomyces sp. ZJ308]